MTTIESILLEEGYQSKEQMLEDYSYLTSLAKIEQYRAGVEFFQRLLANGI